MSYAIIGSGAIGGALAKQFAHRQAQKLAEEIQHRGLNRGHCMNRDPLIERLHSTAVRVFTCESFAHCIQHSTICCDRLPLHKRTRIFEHFANLLTAWHLAHTHIACAVFQEHKVARKERRVRSAEIQQHAVLSRDGNDTHAGHNRGFTGAHFDLVLCHAILRLRLLHVPAAESPRA